MITPLSALGLLLARSLPNNQAQNPPTSPSEPPALMPSFSALFATTPQTTGLTANGLAETASGDESAVFAAVLTRVSHEDEAAAKDTDVAQAAVTLPLVAPQSMVALPEAAAQAAAAEPDAEASAQTSASIRVMAGHDLPGADTTATPDLPTTEPEHALAPALAGEGQDAPVETARANDPSMALPRGTQTPVPAPDTHPVTSAPADVSTAEATTTAQAQMSFRPRLGRDAISTGQGGHEGGPIEIKAPVPPAPAADHAPMDRAEVTTAQTDAALDAAPTVRPNHLAPAASPSAAELPAETKTGSAEQTSRVDAPNTAASAPASASAAELQAETTTGSAEQTSRAHARNTAASAPASAVEVRMVETPPTSVSTAVQPAKSDGSVPPAITSDEAHRDARTVETVQRLIEDTTAAKPDLMRAATVSDVTPMAQRPVQGAATASVAAHRQDAGGQAQDHASATVGTSSSGELQVEPETLPMSASSQQSNAPSDDARLDVMAALNTKAAPVVNASAQKAPTPISVPATQPDQMPVEGTEEEVGAIEARDASIASPETPARPAANQTSGLATALQAQLHNQAASDQGRADAGLATDFGRTAMPDVMATRAETGTPELPAAVTENGSMLAKATAETTAQISAQILRKLEGRQTRFDMVLTPESLGQVDVSLTIEEDGQVVARLAFDNPAAATEMRGRADELRRQLADAGLTLSRENLEFTDRNPQSGSGGHAFDRERDRRAFAGANRLSQDADIGLMPTPAVWSPSYLTPDRVDVKV